MESFQTDRSIFLVGTCRGRDRDPLFGGVVKIDLNKLRHTDVPPFEYVTLFTPGLDDKCQRIHWRACSLSIECTSICLLPIYMYKYQKIKEEDVPLIGFIYDAKTDKILKKFKVPTATKLQVPTARFQGEIFSLEGKIYFLAHTYANFERYDPVEEIWECLPSLPWENFSFGKAILGHAVFDDFVLFDIRTEGIWAFCIKSNKWYKVKTFGDKGHVRPTIVGLGLVLENKTLYALKFGTHEDSVIQVLSIIKGKKNEDYNDDDVVFTCCLKSEIALNSRSLNSQSEFSKYGDDVLVHLGNKEFCLVTSCIVDDTIDYNYHQIVDIVLFILGENNTLVHKHVVQHKIPYPNADRGPFSHAFAFSLPALDSLHFVPKKDTINLDPNPESQNEDVASTSYSEVQVDANASSEEYGLKSPEPDTLHSMDKENGDNITLDQVIQRATSESENKDVADSHESMEYADPSSVVHNTSNAVKKSTKSKSSSSSSSIISQNLYEDFSRRPQYSSDCLKLNLSPLLNFTGLNLKKSSSPPPPTGLKSLVEKLTLPPVSISRRADALQS